MGIYSCDTGSKEAGVCMLDDQQLLDTSLSDLYITKTPNPHQYTSRTGLVVMDVLKFLWGLPWVNVTYYWTQTLRPSYLMATSDHNVLPMRVSEIVVLLDFYSNRNHINKIMMCSTVDLGDLSSTNELLLATKKLRYLKD